MTRRGTTARRPIEPVGEPRFIVLTGLSGSGKSQAIRALEDLEYYCVDNLPIALMPTFGELTMKAGGEIRRAAVVVDVREGSFLTRFPQTYQRLRAMKGLNPTLIFLDANDAALVRRFSETRRPHPLAPGRSVVEGIGEERRRLKPIRKMADLVIDTTDMTVHELRRAFQNLSSNEQGRQGPVVTFLSFGFKHGIPLDADLVFDVRFLPNPHFVPSLREQTGKDAGVVKFLRAQSDTGPFTGKLVELLRFLIPRYAHEGKSYVTVAVGCTGGRHRSVYLAETLRRELKDLPDVRIRVKHRDIAND